MHIQMCRVFTRLFEYDLCLPVRGLARKQIFGKRMEVGGLWGICKHLRVYYCSPECPFICQTIQSDFPSQIPHLLAVYGWKETNVWYEYYEILLLYPQNYEKHYFFNNYKLDRFYWVHGRLLNTLRSIQYYMTILSASVGLIVVWLACSCVMLLQR